MIALSSLFSCAAPRMRRVSRNVGIMDEIVNIGAAPRMRRVSRNQRYAAGDETALSRASHEARE